MESKQQWLFMSCLSTMKPVELFYFMLVQILLRGIIGSMILALHVFIREVNIVIFIILLNIYLSQ